METIIPPTASEHPYVEYEDQMPPECEFESYIALLSYLDPWCLEQGFQNKKQKWVKTCHGRGARYKQEIRCHREAGLDKRSKQRQAANSTTHASKKCFCEWRVFAVASNPQAPVIDGQVSGRYEIRLPQKNTSQLRHNHPGSDILVLPKGRKRTHDGTLVNAVKCLSSVGVAPHKVEAYLDKTIAGAQILKHDIYNLKWRHHLGERKDSTQAERAMKLLEDQGFSKRYDVFKSGPQAGRLMELDAM
ncbi:hypothetical protein K3495_g15642, partial [Podosphaera aphanis]